MSREDSYLNLLQSTASMQFHISVILDAKAMEAEKSRNWLCHHLRAAAYSNPEEQVKKTIEIHDQLINVIGGLTKLEYGLAKNLKVILGHEEQTATTPFGSLFDQSVES